MKETVIFYFSGTGNSFQVAKDIADGLGDTDLMNIGDFKPDMKITAKRIGVVFPVYCWGPPLIVADFADKIPVNAGTYLFTIATYGGLPGAALKILREHFDKRGLSICAAYNIHMPGNCIRSYGAFTESKQKKLFETEKTAAKKIIEDIKNEKTDLKAANTNPVGTAISRKLYEKMMSDCYQSDQYYLVNDSCNSCRICERVCPVHNITIENKKPVWHHKCESCMACIQHCPKKAINYKEKTQGRRRYVNPNVKLPILLREESL